MSWDSNHPSSAGVSLGFNIGGNKNVQDEEDRRLLKELLDQGYPTDAAQFIIERKNKTGKLDLNLPNYQNTLQKGDQPNRPVPLAPVSDIPERSTLKDFSPMSQDAVGVYDYNDPKKLDLLPIPRGTSIRTLIPTNKPIRPAAGSRTDTPEVAAAKATFKSYLKGIAEGYVPPDMYKIMQSAAPVLNLTPEEIPTPDNPVPPTFIQKIFRIKPDQAPSQPPRVITKFPSPGSKDQTLQSDLADAQKAISLKLVTRDEALKRLRQKHGPKVTLP